MNPRKAGEAHVILEVTAPRETIDIDVIVQQFSEVPGGFDGPWFLHRRWRAKSSGGG